MRLQVVAVLSLLLSIPLYAQSPPTPSAPAASDELPAAAQQKLASLEAKLAAAKAANNPHRQADALNQIGDFYMGVSRYQKALDSYTQALATRPRRKRREATSRHPQRSGHRMASTRPER